MSDYTSKEAMEHVERAHELFSQSENAVLRLVPLMAAVLAIFAGLSSLYGGRLGERALTFRNEAVLHEVNASDLWAEYQAESLKAHLYSISALAQSGNAAAAMRAAAAKYRGEQAPLRVGAQRNEAQRDEALRASVTIEKNKNLFQAALALFEVAIVLTSVAAIVKRPWLLVLAGIGGVVGIAVCILGLFGT